MWRWFVSMMDVPEMLGMLDMHLRQRGLTRGGALIIFCSCGIIIMPLLYLYWKFDLESTWTTFSWIATGGQETVKAAIPDENTAQFSLMLLGLGATLLPSAVQFGLARFITIPALGILIKITLAFDLGTDWPTMWEVTSGNAWLKDTFTWGPVAAIVKFLVCAIGTAVSSVVLQSIVILIIAIMVYTGLVLLMGNVPGGSRAGAARGAPMEA